jgi:single-stranded-DNA-specific exonuclease
LKDIDYFNEIKVPNLMNYLGLVALGTVCDVMPIIKLNRVFVAQGLKIIEKRCNLGIKTLFDLANVEEKPNCYHLGFIIGPRINAGGRVGRSDLGANLLSTSDEFEATKIALELDKHNNERKVIELMMLEEAFNIAESQKNESLIFIIGKGWHVGVIGIIAARVKDKYNKPVAVIALNDGIAKASCRSIKGMDFGVKIIEAKNKELILTGGGHAMAAGFTASEHTLSDLNIYLNDLFKQDFDKLQDYGTSEYNSALTTNSITPELIKDLSKLEPYGNGNFEPIFKISNLFVLKADIVGEKHIKCLFVTEKNNYGTKPLSAIAFNAVDSEISKTLLSKRPLSMSVIGTIKINSWQGIERIQIQIKDLITEDNK